MRQVMIEPLGEDRPRHQLRGDRQRGGVLRAELAVPDPIGHGGSSSSPLVAVRKDFGLIYRDKDNTNKTLLCLHRAPLGTHERFIGFLIEHYAGNFPLWLAPDQVRVITLNDDEALINYAKPIVAELR